MASKMQLTKDGYLRITEELSDLKSKRDLLINRIEEVSQLDESGEDGLTVQLKEELEMILAKIEKLEEAVETAQIINGAVDNSFVQVGCKVKIKISGNLHKEFNIVSELEADPTANKISDKSPLGLALIGKKLNDEVQVEAPVGKITYKIVSIA